MTIILFCTFFFFCMVSASSIFSLSSNSFLFIFVLSSFTRECTIPNMTHYRGWKYFHNLQVKNEEYRDAHSHHENYGTICFMPQSSKGTTEKNLLMQEQESNHMKVASLRHISSPTNHNVQFPRVMVIPPTLPDAYCMLAPQP